MPIDVFPEASYKDHAIAQLFQLPLIFNLHYFENPYRILVLLIYIHNRELEFCDTYCENLLKLLRLNFESGSHECTHIWISLYVMCCRREHKYLVH